MTALHIFGLAETKNIELDFLFRMHNLVSLHTNKQLSSKIVLRVLKSRLGRTVGCRIQNNLVNIEREDREMYHLEVTPEKEVKTEKIVNYDLLVECCDHLENMQMNSFHNVQELAFVHHTTDFPITL